MPRSSRPKPVGSCSLCQQKRQLTFEHIPPQAAGNTDPLWAQSINEWLSSGPAYLRGGRPQGRQQQRGAGGHWLCGECNSLLGTTLVPEYAKWARPVGAAFRGAAALLDWADRVQEPSFVETTWEKRRPGVFARQALAMCVTAGGGLPDSDRHASLLAAVHTEDAQDCSGFPPLHVRFYAGPQARMGPVQGMLRLTRAGWASSVAWEVAYPPFAFTLTLDGAPPEDTFDLREWLALSTADTAGHVLLKAPLGFGHTFVFGDFRSRATVARDAGEPDIAPPVERTAADSGVWTRFPITAKAACTVNVVLAGRWSLPARHDGRS